MCKCGEPLETARQCAKCRQQTNKRARILARKRKLTAITHYGGCCRFCGEIRNIFLTIDHIDGKGAEHRKKEKITTGTNTYRWLEKNNYPSGFQVACFNCNAAKAQIGEEKLRRILKY